MLRILNTACVMVGLLSLSITLFSGCEQKPEARPFNAADNVDPHDHDHGGLGPHLGHIVELGNEEYHAEVTFDIVTRELAVWMLGPDAKSPAPLADAKVSLQLKIGDAPKDFELTPASQEGEPTGSASKFEWAGEALPESIKNAEMLIGKVQVTIGDKSYTGEISHDHGHDDHGHGHGHAH